MRKQLPQQLIKSLRGVPGFDEDAFIRVHQSAEQVVSIRYNPSKVSEQQIDQRAFPALADLSKNAAANAAPQVISPVPWCTTGRYLSARPSFTLDPIFHAGAYYVQEASSMFLDHVLATLYNNEEPPLHVLDLCAAPGGKSTLLASRLTDSFIVANEVIKNRVTILAENISKWGSGQVAVTHNDPADFKRLPGFFDLIVVDAPCSGSGLFRKDERAIDEWSEANVAHCSLRQQRILSDVLPALKEGGILIYSTCSYSPQEDEAIADWLVNDRCFQPISIPIDQSWGIVESSSQLTHASGYRFYPNHLQGEGFYISCFRNTKDSSDDYQQTFDLPKPLKPEVALVQPWLQQPEALYLFKQKETIIAFPLRWLEAFATVQKQLNVRKSGVAIGVVKGKDLVPHHELALSHYLHADVPSVELNETEAIAYLKRADLQLETPVKGWALAWFDGLNLGWMKLLGNRLNNYYPTEWRILKP